MRHRLLKSAAVALTVAAIAVPLAGAATAQTTATSRATPNSTPSTPTTQNLTRTDHRRGLQVRIPPTPRNPHLQRTNPTDPEHQPSFHWSDAATGAGTAAVAIFLAAAAGLVLSRRRTRIAV